MNPTLAIALVLTLALPVTALSETPDEKGRRIAEEADKQTRGFQSVEAVGEMSLEDSFGNKSVRRFRTKALEMDGDTNRSMIVFERPRDIAGTAVLTHTHNARDDSQWLYLPALKRVKRISSGGKTSSFAGSEFSYEDLIRAPIDRYTYRWLRDEPCPGQDDLLCYVSERIPVDDNSGYKRQVLWIDQEHYRVHRVDFYDRKDAHLKSLIPTDYRLYEDRFWLADVAKMTNHRTGKTTTMTWSDRDFSVELDEYDLSQRALQRIR